MKPLFEKVRCSIRSEKIPPEFYGVRMVHLSDLHGAWFGKNHSLLIKAIDDFHPDMVLMTGDMADSKKRRTGKRSCAVPPSCQKISCLLQHWEP